MKNALAPVADRLGKLIRLLSSDKEHEVLGAAHAILRTLSAEKLDIHVLASAIENKTMIAETDMRKIYNTCFDDGRRSVEADKQSFVDVVDAGDWREIAEFCRNRDDRINEKERTFVNDIMARVVWREPSERQQKWLLSIFYRLGGRHS